MTLAEGARDEPAQMRAGKLKKGGRRPEVTVAGGRRGAGQRRSAGCVTPQRKNYLPTGSIWQVSLYRSRLPEVTASLLEWEVAVGPQHNAPMAPEIFVRPDAQ